MFDRTIALIGQDNLDKIESKNILIIGVGGVGGYAIEALIRSGIHNITLVDYDNIDISNINRQIIAKESNVGKLKVEAWKERINETNSSVLVNTLPLKIDENNIDILFKSSYDYIIDACDTVIVKKLLIKKCHEKNIKLIIINLLLNLDLLKNLLILKKEHLYRLSIFLYYFSQLLFF